MLKKLLLISAALSVSLFILPGCSGGEKNGVQPTAVQQQSETAEQSLTQGEPQNETQGANTEKETLPLVHFSQTELPPTEPAEITVGELNLPANGLYEMPEQKYENREEFSALEEYVKNVFSVELNENWSITVHYYDEAQTAGMVRLRYDIGEIKTNKAFTFSVEDGMIVSVFSSCIADETDEQALLERVNKFREAYEQEKYEPKNGETLTDETTDLSYFYNTGELRYTYNVFFTYADGIINNDYGTEVSIGENGKVIGS